ncbi:BCP inhibitor [Operophtera brumata]|uniref:BCP inhibitor n=1 Tax=Operophtera brumata TaxID=104452 RepID=A0A0L7KR82_OPEBR|nr:BCP inhibitor [Operophtera brumata]
MDAPRLFQKFKFDYNRVYKSTYDQEVHYIAIVNNLLEINKLNAEYPMATYGINQLADYTPAESIRDEDAKYGRSVANFPSQHQLYINNKMAKYATLDQTTGYTKSTPRINTEMSSIGVLTLLAIVAMAGAAGKTYYDVEKAPELFETFMKDNNRVYKDDADRDTHYAVFVDNLKKINKLNKDNPITTFGINKFADYTAEEQKTLYGFNPKKKSKEKPKGSKKAAC